MSYVLYIFVYFYNLFYILLPLRQNCGYMEFKKKYLHVYVCKHTKEYENGEVCMQADR